MIITVDFTKEGFVRLIDQRLLPAEEVVVECGDYLQVAEAIRNMTVRGAPAIGVAAAGGVALGARAINTADVGRFE
ncbi:MAG: S-methyl-5-thioribose-1-phosphate isomerase, partial [Nitrospinae bacterium]|nr:S-methyl-5-thioribose-1-phosphate isomerase [Nitrospinota bacterium]